MKKYDLGPLPKIHHREALVDKASIGLSTHLMKWLDEYPDLTYAEQLMLISCYLCGTTRSIIHIERRNKE